MEKAESPFKKLAIQMIPGLLPLVIFILADEIWGTTIGLIVALVLGISEFFYVWWRQKKIDKFILADTGLLLILGSVSLISNNDLFFKLKPALIQVIFLVIIGIAAFGNPAFLIKMGGRYMGEMGQMNPQGEQMMQKMLRRIFVLITLHTGLVIYAALYMSKEAWGFISGGLFYILIGVYFASELLSKKLKKTKLQAEEWFPLVDTDGRVIGQAPRSECHNGPGKLHPVAHLHVINSHGELLLQLRASTKDLLPGKWDTAVGGHIGIGESVEQGLRRESMEEIGLIDFRPSLLQRYIWETKRESELVFSFMCTHDGPFKADPVELDNLRFWTKKELDANIGKGIFTAVFENEYHWISKHLK
jgi:isopentenyldiphosphate isomerase/intracellular septation protein A